MTTKFAGTERVHAALVCSSRYACHIGSTHQPIPVGGDTCRKRQSFLDSLTLEHRADSTALHDQGTSMTGGDRAAVADQEL